MGTKVKDLISAISIKLDEIFKGEYNIYTEGVKQGFDLPAFFIENVYMAQKQKLGKRYKKDNIFVIYFFPEENGNETDKCLEVADTLLNEFEYIAAGGGLFRGTNMKSRVVDKVLNLTIEFNYHILKDPEKQDYMEILTQNIKAKG